VGDRLHVVVLGSFTTHSVQCHLRRSPLRVIGTLESDAVVFTKNN
jgi:hypothetical protein